MEQRRAPRIQPFVASCRYVVREERFAGFLTNLSRSGARVHSDAEPPAPDTPITVEVRLGGQATHVRIAGTVRWNQPSPRGGSMFGMSFDRIGAEEQRILDDVIEEFRRRAAQLT